MAINSYTIILLFAFQVGLHHSTSDGDPLRSYYREIA